MKLNKLLILIVVLAGLVRLVGLSSLPPALNRDEAGIGWNAYSILTTQADEHNQTFPLAFKSIGDYKMPLYIYATTLPVALFGLTDFSIRFWSALAGIISVVAVYGLTLQLTKKPKTALLAALFMALNPWAVFYSRIGFEANLSLAFFLSGLYFLARRFPLGLGLFLLSFLTYSSSLIFTPIFIFFLFLFQIRKNLNLTKIICLLIFTLLTLVIFKSVYAVSAQKSYVTIFNNPTIIDTYHHLRTDVFEQNPLLARTWFNQKFYLFRIFAGNYLKTFSPKFLIFSGGNHPWYQVPGLGNFYLIEIVLALSGLYWLIRKNTNSILKSTLLIWLLVAPIPSAVTIDAPHSTRSLQLLPAVLILAAIGAWFIFETIKSKTGKAKIFFLSFIVYLVGFLYAGYQYIFIYPRQLSTSIPVGLKQVLNYVKANSIPGKLYLTDIHNSTYLYPLIYLKLNPREFQQSAHWTGPDTLGLSDAYQINQNIQIVNNLDDMIDPQVVILPENQAFNNSDFNLAFSSFRYRLYLKNH